jgi:hypothetical protein
MRITGIKAGAALAITPLVAAVGLVAAAGPASASCNFHSSRNIDPGGGSTRGTVYLRPGPHENCGGTLRNGYFDYDCYTYNEVDNLWTKVRINGVEGWIWNGNLLDGGSNYLC